MVWYASVVWYVYQSIYGISVNYILVWCRRGIIDGVFQSFGWRMAFAEKRSNPCHASYGRAVQLMHVHGGT